MTRRPALTGAAGLAVTAASIALTFAVAVAGTSVMEPPLPGRPGQPPWALDAHLSGYAAVTLAGTGLLAGALGLALTLGAMRRGWAVPARPVLLAGLVAAAGLTLVPPFGSSDPLSYAAYGRMLVTGHNPYAMGPDVLARLGDPVARAVLDWKSAPSDYGTLATGAEALASLAGGTSARLTVFVLALGDLAAFAGTALLLHRMTRGRPGGQLRAALLWTCNPLLLQVLVSGEHVDSQGIVFGVAAVAVFGPVVPLMRRRLAGSPGTRGADASRDRAPAGRPGGGSPGAHGGLVTVRAALLRSAAAGALAGLGFAVKVTLALVGAGLLIAAVAALWPVAGGARGVPAPSGSPEPPGAHTPQVSGAARQRWAPLGVVAAGLAAGFAVPAGAALAIGGPDSIRQMGQASSMVSIGSPWRAARSALRLAAGEAAAGGIVKGGAIALMLLLIVLLLRGLPRAGGGDLSPAVARAAFAFALAWLMAWTYLLPWYDSLAWALLPLLPASGVDWLLLARTAALACGYLPARVAGVVMPPGLRRLESVVRSGVTPAILAVVTTWLAVLMWRRPAPLPLRSGPAGATVPAPGPVFASSPPPSALRLERQGTPPVRRPGER